MGRLQLVAHCVWAYIAFSVYMLIWIADLPREITFFLARERGVWGGILIAIAFGRFVVPFLLLLPREPKRHWAFVGALGALTLVMHALECVWLVVPDVASAPRVLDFAAIALLGACGLAVAALRFRRHDALPADPKIDEALAYEAS